MGQKISISDNAKAKVEKICEKLRQIEAIPAGHGRAQSKEQIQRSFIETLLVYLTNNKKHPLSRACPAITQPPNLATFPKPVQESPLKDIYNQLCMMYGSGNDTATQKQFLNIINKRREKNGKSPLGGSRKVETGFIEECELPVDPQATRVQAARPNFSQLKQPSFPAGQEMCKIIGKNSNNLKILKSLLFICNKNDPKWAKEASVTLPERERDTAGVCNGKDRKVLVAYLTLLHTGDLKLKKEKHCDINNMVKKIKKIAEKQSTESVPAEDINEEQPLEIPEDQTKKVNEDSKAQNPNSNSKRGCARPEGTPCPDGEEGEDGGPCSYPERKDIGFKGIKCVPISEPGGNDNQSGGGGGNESDAAKGAKCNNTSDCSGDLRCLYGSNDTQGYCCDPHEKGMTQTQTGQCYKPLRKLSDTWELNGINNEYPAADTQEGFGSFLTNTMVNFPRDDSTTLGNYYPKGYMTVTPGYWQSQGRYNLFGGDPSQKAINYQRNPWKPPPAARSAMVGTANFGEWTTIDTDRADGSDGVGDTRHEKVPITW